MGDMSEPLALGLLKLSPQPGDVLVVYAPEVKSPEVGGEIVEMMYASVPRGVKIVVTTQALDFALLRAGKPVPPAVDEPTTVGER